MKRPEPGKVKTRLARTIGNEQAATVYKALLERTLAITKPLSVSVQIHYSTTPEDGDLWDCAGYDRFAQKGDDLGQRMLYAFEQAFQSGYSKVVIMGSDCYQLDTQRVNEAFDVLERSAAVIGPSTDGGYYLLGMNRLIPQVFSNKVWSTESVASDTLSDFNKLSVACEQLPPLTDIDSESDLVTLPIELREFLNI